MLTKSSVNEAHEETAPKNVSSFAHQVVLMNIEATDANANYGNVLNGIAENESSRNSLARSPDRYLRIKKVI